MVSGGWLVWCSNKSGIMSGLRNKGNFLNQTTLTVARATVFYCILCGRRKESDAVHVMIQQHNRRKLLTQQCRQNNNIAKNITHKPIQYNK